MAAPPGAAGVCCRVPPEHPSCEDKWGRLLLTHIAEDDLPADPRGWSRSDVARWLLRAASKHNLRVHTPRFLMNGKALCLMTPDMYLSRVPVGGKLLYRDFQIRLARALYTDHIHTFE